MTDVTLLRCFKCGKEFEEGDNEMVKELVEALRQCLSDLKWAEGRDKRSNFQSSIILATYVLTKLEGRGKEVRR